MTDPTAAPIVRGTTGAHDGTPGAPVEICARPMADGTRPKGPDGDCRYLRGRRRRRPVRNDVRGVTT